MHNPSHRKIVNAWCMYDWANSAFATTVMAAVLPIFFRNISTVNLPTSQTHLASSIWGYTSAAAMLAVACLSLILGPVSDLYGGKKKYLSFFILLGASATAVLTLMGAGSWIWVSILFIFGTIGYAGSEVFYDSLLPHIVRTDETDRISTRGYALGYVGGGILLAINILMIWWLPKTYINSAAEPVPLLGMQLSFLSVAVWWVLFSIPILRIVPEPIVGERQHDRELLFRVAWKRISTTLREIRRYREAFLFLIAFWFYNDGIGTIIKMATAYGDEIGIGTMDLVGALMLTQIVGIPCSLLFGKWAGRIGTKRSILVGLGVYMLITVGGFFITRAIHFWILALLVGLVQGGTQALSRSLYASMIPKYKSAEFFSFYNISGKFAGIIGPVLFGLASQIAKSSRWGILSLLLFFIIGGGILLAVDVEKGRKSAAREMRHP